MAKDITFRACECRNWFAKAEDGATRLTACEDVVAGKAKFRPGHDARLKGALIKAKHAETLVTRADGNEPVWLPPTEWAAKAEFGFAAMVANAVPREKKSRKPSEAEIVAREQAEAEAKEIARNEAEALARVLNATTAPKPHGKPRPTRRTAALTK